MSRAATPPRMNSPSTADSEEPKHVDCPFCDITTFDLIGLKRHFLNGHCDVFNDTPLDDGEPA